MILAVAATEFEMNPFLQLLAEDGEDSSQEGVKPSCFTLIAGVGPVETTLRLTRYLERCDPRIDKVLNFGVAGAYLCESSSKGDNASILDLCLAEQESLGDFGICFADHLEVLDEKLGASTVFPLDQSLLHLAGKILAHHQIAYHCGNFVTVSAASATRQRGAMLAARFQGLCENMEGAAAARVCAEFSLPLLEVRAVSNLVEDRDLKGWKMAEACSMAARAAALLVREIGGRG
ncbi:MAG: futalosine hydrolase [Proteobacteria bacterium]|nr:futalosine hydrolase [Pseudomonadota bacterium]MBU1649551.1 futalosine hydrolase [Pseudomonadota bacterium]MBU1986048.1 futalosine hydrolase [Pseudomonadota bacterium]